MAMATTLNSGEAALLVEEGDRQRRLAISKTPFTIGLEAVQLFCGNSEAQDDRTLVVLERIK